MALSVLLLGACSKGNDEGDGAAAPVTAATTSPAPTTTAPAPTTTEASTTTTVDMRSVEVPPGAPPLPLYSGDPVLMTEALFQYICWIDQHPLDAAKAVDVYAVPGSDVFERHSSELKRVVEAGGLVLSDCGELVQVTPVATDGLTDFTAMALMETARPFAEEVAPDGTRTALPTWNSASLLVEWSQQPDGRWMVATIELRSRT